MLREPHAYPHTPAFPAIPQFFPSGSLLFAFGWRESSRLADVSLPNNWLPRPYQEPLWRYLWDGGRRAVSLWHRRSGKDDVGLHATACGAHRRVGNYWYLLPEYAQARKSMWDAVDPHSGERRIDAAFPRALRRRWRDDEMKIEFKNGSTFQLVGSDNFNSLVGSPPVGLVFSEYALSNPAAWGYLRPILLENDGWALFNSTPRGNNHYKAMCTLARARMVKDEAGRAEPSGWFFDQVTAAESGVFTDAQLQSELEELQALHGDDYGRAMWLQEYFCSFDAAIPGAIFGDQIELLRRAGQIGKVPIDAALPMYTGWDLGHTDDTTIWWAQVLGDEVRLVGYYADSGKDIPFYCRVLDEHRQLHGYRYGIQYLPHDARPRTLAAGGKSMHQQFTAENKRLGSVLGSFVIAPRLDKQEQIQAARATLSHAWIDATECEEGLECLINYRRVWDEEKRAFSTTPVHDWCVTGDTLIWTRYGTHQIMHIPEAGEVLTSCGWKPYHSPRITRINAPLVEVVFAGGYTVKCTPDHPFLTVSGWIYAAHLRPGTLIQSSLTRSRSISMAVCTALGRASDICRAAARNCTAKCGELLLAIFQPAVTFTTETAIRPTMPSGIWNVSPPRSMPERAARNDVAKDISPLPRGVKRSNGISRRLGCFGIDDTASACGSRPSVLKRVALSVRSASLRLTGWLGAFRCIAANPAVSLRIESVRRLNYSANVWCLTVPGLEEFSLSNGAIVHNSSHGADGLMTLAVAWKRGARPKGARGAETGAQAAAGGGSVGGAGEARSESFGSLKRRHLAKARERRALRMP